MNQNQIFVFLRFHSSFNWTEFLRDSLLFLFLKFIFKTFYWFRVFHIFLNKFHSFQNIFESELNSDMFSQRFHWFGSSCQKAFLSSWVLWWVCVSSFFLPKFFQWINWSYYLIECIVFFSDNYEQVINHRYRCPWLQSFQH